MATTAVAIPDEVVMNKIYVIRDQKVMLDRDLAALVANAHSAPCDQYQWWN